MSLTYAFSIVNWVLGKSVLENTMCFSSLILNYWCSITMLWNFQKFWTSGTCWKPAHPNYLPYRFSHILQPCLPWEKWKVSIFFKTIEQNKTFSAQVVTIQSSLIISTLLISNNPLSWSENLVPVLTQRSANRQQNIVEKRRNCSKGAISPLFHNIFNIYPT